MLLVYLASNIHVHVVKATTLSKHVVTHMRKLFSQNGGQKHLESAKGLDLCFVSLMNYHKPLIF